MLFICCHLDGQKKNLILDVILIITEIEHFFIPFLPIGIYSVNYQFTPFVSDYLGSAVLWKNTNVAVEFCAFV